jgi:aminodeoxychorismate synthase component I
MGSKKKPSGAPLEPDVYLALFDVLVVHDYDTGATRFVGNTTKFDRIKEKLLRPVKRQTTPAPLALTRVDSNFTKTAYLAAVGTIRERIRQGDTYQTNLTQQMTAKLAGDLTPEIIFERLRRDHPAPFAAFIKRKASTVISISPERFFCVDNDGQTISTSPIKGTRQRGQTPEDDAKLRAELLASVKDRAENTMIVDLLRNDLGRVCEYGSVRVESLCEIEEHPTLFHLVSTVSGKLNAGTSFSLILKALFPCGSITGAPKISTMRIIDEIETATRGLSMGAIGYYIPPHPESDLTWDMGPGTWDQTYDLSVAIRTMVITDGVAEFNVGGGIVIDSDPESEYMETLTKAKALLAAIDGYLE